MSDNYTQKQTATHGEIKKHTQIHTIATRASYNPAFPDDDERYLEIYAAFVVCLISCDMPGNLMCCVESIIMHVR